MSIEQITAEQAIENLANVAHSYKGTAQEHAVLQASLEKVHADRLRLAKLEVEHAGMVRNLEGVDAPRDIVTSSEAKEAAE